MLKQYKHNPTIVKAAQFTIENHKSFGTFKKQFGSAGELLFLEDTKKMGKVLMFKGEVVPINSYIVMGLDKNIYPVSMELFRMLYTPVKEAKNESAV